MENLKDKKHFIGIDISNETLDVSVIEKGGKKPEYQDLNDVTNSIKGFANIASWIKKQKKVLKDCLFCMEHTGTYGLLLFAWLTEQNIDFVVEPGYKIKRSLGITRGKNDKIDARRLAAYAYTHREDLELFKMPCDLIIKLKQLLTYRDQCVRTRTSFKNSLKNHKQYEKLTGLKGITDQIKKDIKEYDAIVTDLEKQIVKVIESDPQVKKNFELTRSIKGIGLVIAAFMLMSTNNFTSFENGRKYACYAGIAPFEYQSGSSIKGKSRVSHLGNKDIKALLSNGCNSAIQWDPEIKRYYERKAQEGKEHKLIVNAISCKMVNRVFAVVKRQTPFVQLFEHNFEKVSARA